MSLLGNRGRFSSDQNFENNNTSSGNASELSSIGKNPSKFIKKDEKANAKDKISEPKDDIRERLIRANLSKALNNSGHLKYNNKVAERNINSEKTYNSVKETKNTNSVKKKRIGVKTIVAMVVVEMLTIAAIFMFSPILRIKKMTQDIQFDKTKVVSPYIDENTLNIMKGYKTLVVFGVDSRNGSVAKGANADVNIIINLNVENGDVQLISLYRDLYLSVTDNNIYDKLNSAYRRSGPEGAVKTINKNFDLNITNYFAFNWKAVADGISLLGGVDLEISNAEYKYMNAFIHETCIATGIDAKNPAAHYIKGTGMQHLDGVQAVAYGRLRLMDSDFQRVDRQKKVISLCLQKAKTLDLATLRLIIESVLPQIAYEFDFNEMISLLRLVNSVTITESTACPELSNAISMDMGSAGSCVVPINLEKAVTKLHYIMFNEEDYKTSDAVKRYSNRISELRHKHQEENAAKAESERNKIGTATVSVVKKAVNKTIATSSSASNQTNKSEKVATGSIVEVGVSPSDARNDENKNNDANKIVIEGLPGVINETTVANEEVVIGLSPGEKLPEKPASSDTGVNTSASTGAAPGGPTVSGDTIVEPVIVIP